MIAFAQLAEREGFEPPEPVRAQRFSRPPLSTAQPSLQKCNQLIMLWSIHSISVIPAHQGDDREVRIFNAILRRYSTSK
jgi:hypothetical protein